METNIQAAARLITNADALLISAGAGIGVDSGLPDFRGDEGFWKAYPPFEALGLRFVDAANPRGFQSDAAQSWGFYGHRFELYNRTEPHEGFQILRRWAREKSSFVFTSNVDGQFQKAGFDERRIVECHGSLQFWQCVEPCCDATWPADASQLDIDEESFRAQEPLPSCPHCDQIARPNVLMFGDGAWIWNRTQEQQNQMEAWAAGLSGAEMVIIEIGAGRAIPTVRNLGEELQRSGAHLIRINPRESEGRAGTISIATGALEALRSIEQEINHR